MTIRRLNRAEQIEALKIEMRNRQMSLERLVHKFETTGYLTQDERELANIHTAWINKNTKTIKDFLEC